MFLCGNFALKPFQIEEIMSQMQMRKKPTIIRSYFTMESAMTAILRDASGKMHHGILFDRRLGFTRIWYTGRIRRELLLKSTISGVPTILTPYPFPPLFFLLTSFSVCSLHGPHKITPRVRTNFLPVQPV